VTAWARHREEELARLAADAAEREVEGCTFQPVLNRASRELTRGMTASLAVASMDGSMASPVVTAGVHERLYRTGGARSRTPAGHRRRGGGGGGGDDGGSVGTYSVGPGASGRSHSHTAAARYMGDGRPLFTSLETGSPRGGGAQLPFANPDGEEPLTKAEEDALRECTFKPAINTTYDARPVRSKYVPPTMRDRT